MPFRLPDFPLHEGAWIFATLMLLVLVVPRLVERIRMPGIVGLVLAGMVVGPHVLGAIERDGTMEVLGAIGLLYLMFVAGLELDLEEFAANRRHSLLFGVLTFVLPMGIGVGVIFAMGFDLLAALLLASCWASHTLLTYPVFRRTGSFSNRAVASSVGATILTDTAALLVLVVVARAYEGALGPAFWLTLVPSLLALLFLILWVLPRIGRWFFGRIGQDRGARFVFVLVALFGSSALAELAGVEAIIGAFLAGLAMNKLVPNRGGLMERIEFLGSHFLIPLFLLSVGMLIDPWVLADPSTLGIAAGFTAVALGAKLLAALIAGRALRYDPAEIGSMFALSSAQAAATLAAVIIGLQVGLIQVETVNAVVLVILITCIVSSWAANRYAPRLPRPDRKQALGEKVIVPLARPESAIPLMRIASAFSIGDAGMIVPLTVVPSDSPEQGVELARARVMRAQEIAQSAGAEADPIVRVDAAPEAGVLHTVREHDGSLLILGWKGRQHDERLFGGIIDALVVDTPVPMLIARMDGRPFLRVVVSISESNTVPSSEAGLHLALATAKRLSGEAGLPVAVLSNTREERALDLVREVLDVEPIIDERKRSVAVRTFVQPDDLVIVPVKPNRSGLRGAASRIARAVPGNQLIVALDSRGSAVGAATASAASDALTHPVEAPPDLEPITSAFTATGDVLEGDRPPLP